MYINKLSFRWYKISQARPKYNALNNLYNHNEYVMLIDKQTKLFNFTEFK